MGRKSRKPVARVLIINEEDHVERYYDVGPNLTPITLEEPLTHDIFLQVVGPRSMSNSTSQTPQQSAPTTSQSSSHILKLREQVLDKPEFEGEKIFDFDCEEENNELVFDTQSFTKDLTLLEGTMNTYDPTAFYTRNHN